jgi:hypothetical protein
MKNNRDVIEEWLNTSILPHKERWLHCHWMYHCCFNKTTMSPTEGCNASKKTNLSLAMKPSQGIDTLAKTMTQQSTVQLTCKQKDAIYAANSMSLWLHAPTANDV